MISFQQELVKDIKDELFPLLELHKEEVGVYASFELDPMWDRYYSAEDSGQFMLATVRDDDTLVGYVAYFISQSLHYSSETYADMDVIYVLPNYRTVGVGSSLITLSEEILKEDYLATMINIRMKSWSPFEELAESLNYDKMEYIYTKEV